METTKILSAGFLDILFDGRNKAYGAYELRQTYAKRMWQAMGITFLLFLLIGGSAYIKNSFTKKSASGVIISPDVNIIQIPPDDVEDEPPPPPPPTKKVDVPKVQTVKLTTPVIVENDKVVTPPPTQDEIKDSRIGDIMQEGVKENFIVAPPAAVDGNKGIVIVKKPAIEEEIIEKVVTTEAAYLGGAAAWRTFLERNLRGEVPVENGAEPKNYTVIIQFVVDKDGNLSDIKPLTKLGFGMEDEAVRVIRKSGKWRPAVLNGKEVKAYRKQPITFRVLEQ